MVDILVPWCYYAFINNNTQEKQMSIVEDFKLDMADEFDISFAEDSVD